MFYNKQNAAKRFIFPYYCVAYGLFKESIISKICLHCSVESCDIYIYICMHVLICKIFICQLCIRGFKIWSGLKRPIRLKHN